MPCTIRLLADLHTQGLDKPIPEATCGTLDDNCVVTFVLDGVERRVRLNAYRLHRLVEVIAANGDGIPVDCVPDEDELHSLVCDSICPSITGESVEPDGHDSHGAPSWMLLLGLV